MTDGSSIICAGATLDVASLLPARSAGCTKAEAPVASVSARTERNMVEVDLVRRPSRRPSRGDRIDAEVRFDPRETQATAESEANNEEALRLPARRDRKCVIMHARRAA